MDLRLPLLLALTLFASVYADVTECYACIDSSSNAYCRDDVNIVTCGTDEYCQTEITKDGDDVTITKKCTDATTCSDEEDDNHGFCDDGIVKTNCKYCCEDELCNEEIPHYHEAFDGCGPWGDWSNCDDCSRNRVRTCGKKSKSSSQSGDRRRREDEDEEEVEFIDAERMVLRRSKRHSSSSSKSSKSSSSGSGSSSGSREIEEETDDCCVNSCSVCDSMELNIPTAGAGLTAFITLLDDVTSACPVESCNHHQAYCQTIVTYSATGDPSISKGCVSASTCNAYESTDNCPNFVDSFEELFLVAVNLLGTPLTCSYCCDNGVDENGVICNSALIIPDAVYLTDNAPTSVASLLATVVMVVFARIFGI